MFFIWWYLFLNRYQTLWNRKTSGPWWPWSHSPEPSRLWCSIKEQGFKSHSLGYKHMIFYDLTQWPTFWPDMSHFQICTKCLTKFHEYQTENLVSAAYTRFFLRFDLAFDPTWHIFKLFRDFIETNILTKFLDYRTENVVFRVYTRFF